MPTTDSAAATIVKRCDEVLAAEGAQYTYWGQKAQDLARDLRDAVEKLHKIERLSARAGMPGPVYVEQTSEQVEALGRIARSVLTTIAERGEGRE